MELREWLGEHNLGRYGEALDGRLMRFLALLTCLLFALIPVRASEDGNEIQALVDSLATPGARGYTVAQRLAEFKGEAVPQLILGLKAKDVAVRQWCARALTNIVGGYGKTDGRPLTVSAGGPLLAALATEQDAIAVWYMVQAVQKVRPPASAAIPVLLGVLERSAVRERRQVVEAMASYQEEAAAAKPALRAILLADDEDEWLRQDALMGLREIGLTTEDVHILSTLRFAEGRSLDHTVLSMLWDQPDFAMAFLEAHPGILAKPTFGAAPLGLIQVILSKDPETEALRKYLHGREDLPPLAMVCFGDPAFIPRINTEIDQASSHQQSFLRASTRALGAPPDEIVRITMLEEGKFRPQSAHPNVDKKRMGEGGGHGDGFTFVLVTGRLLMADGNPAESPRFYNTNDRMLMGRRHNDPVELLSWDAVTGRFAFVTTVFAAYSMGKGQEEPGPYQTGAARMRVEAVKAMPTPITIYDEMPDVEIVLEPGRGYTDPARAVVDDYSDIKMPEPSR